MVPLHMSLKKNIQAKMINDQNLAQKPNYIFFIIKAAFAFSVSSTLVYQTLKANANVFRPLIAETDKVSLLIYNKQ